MMLRTYPGYAGVATPQQAQGAIPNGTRVCKINSEGNDTHRDGALATILGSVRHPVDGFAYFVEWDDLPRNAVVIAYHRIQVIQ